MKTEQTECSETSAYKIQTQENWPEESIQHLEQGESLKSRILIVNCITNSCIWNTGVTWQVIDYKLSKDDTIVSKHVEVW
jgi:hypothetical protein